MFRLNSFKHYRLGEYIADLHDVDPYVYKITQLVSVPQDVYKRLYQDVLHKVMEYCQAMPDDMQKLQEYSLIKRNLELTVAVLRIRRAKMFPIGSDSETIAAQDASWTFALFLAGLLMGLHRVQIDRVVEFYRSKTEQIPYEDVLSGTIYPTYYKLSDATPSQISYDIPQLQKALLDHILPPMGKFWLGRNADLNALLMDAVTYRYKQDNPLITIIAKAASFTHFPFHEIELINMAYQQQKGSELPQVKTTQRSPEFEHGDLIQTLNDWLSGQVKKQADAKRSSPQILRLKNGLFITFAVLEAFIHHHSLPYAHKAFIEKFNEYFVKENERVNFQYRAKRLEERQILEGCIIKKAHLNATLKAIPIQTHFIPNIAL